MAERVVRGVAGDREVIDDEQHARDEQVLLTQAAQRAMRDRRQRPAYYQAYRVMLRFWMENTLKWELGFEDGLDQAVYDTIGLYSVRLQQYIYDWLQARVDYQLELAQDNRQQIQPMDADGAMVGWFSTLIQNMGLTNNVAPWDFYYTLANLNTRTPFYEAVGVLVGGITRRYLLQPTVELYHDRNPNMLAVMRWQAGSYRDAMSDLRISLTLADASIRPRIDPLDPRPPCPDENRPVGDRNPFSW